MTDRPLRIGLMALFVLSFAACQPADRGQEEATREDAEADVVTVTAKDFEFQAPKSIRSGWTTFRFVNEGEQEHFFLLHYLPENKGFVDYRTEVVDPFLEVWNHYDAGELTREEAARSLGEEIATWFLAETEQWGGAALTEPGRTSQVTLNLDPGTYVMECYVKTPQGTWHTDRGMLRELIVTEEPTGARPPEADVEMTLSNYEVAISDSFRAGPQTVAVRATESPEGFLPHDINLFRLESDTTTVEELAAWMDWMDFEEFRAPAPGVSMGGMKTLTAGHTGYVTVDLEPGRYAWVSEGYADRGMVKEFTVE